MPQVEEIPIPTHVCEEAAALTREERDALSEEFLALSSLERVTKQRRLAMLRVLDAANAWEGWPTCAEWLSFMTGMSLVTARTHVRIARQLAYLPNVDEAFGRGELSYSKVRLLCSVLQPEVTDPKYELRLVAQARAFTTEQLRRVIGCTRNVLKGGAEAAAERERRTSFRVEQLAGGMTVIQCFLPSDVAARVVGVVERAMEDLVKKRPEAPAVELVETLEELSGSVESVEPGESESAVAEADGVVEGVEEQGVVLGSAADPSGSNGPRRVGDPAGSPREEGLRPSVAMADGFVAVFEHYLEHRSCGQPGKPGEVLLTVSVDTLTGTMAHRCQLSPALVQQWTCDAVVQPVLTDARGEVLDVGRRHRVVPPRLRRALGLRDGEACQFPGCGARAFLEAHHLKPWLQGGETKLGNLALICRRHHRFLHQAEFKVELREEGLVFRDPSGKALRLPELPVVHDPRRELDELLRAARFSSGGLRCLDGKTNYDRCWASDGIIESVRRGQGAGPLPRESALPVPA
ncbi:MAG TPA: hypothetical protein DEA08_02590 [Planctomycetes bacterium]|nr:hypothetical protein [Planctomycetota bacterium]